MSRLVVIGSLIGDQMMTVPHLPERGGDVLAGPVEAQPGGAFNIVAAAARLGMPTVVAGRIGRGPVGDMLASALAALGVDVLLPSATDGDSGTSIGFIEPDGERTFVTSPGVEQTITPADLASVAWRADDSVYVSGYDLLYPETGPAVAAWLTTFRPATLLVDPGPLIAEVPDDVLAAVLAATTAFSLNEREVQLLGGLDAVWPLLTRSDAVIVVRAGAEGAWLHRKRQAPLHVPGHRVTVVDTTGAGDAHAGALLAFLAEGLPIPEALRRANAAAALAVAVRGSATAPTKEALSVALQG